MHYYRWRRHGDPLTNKRPELQQSLEERFWSKVRSEGDCLIWTSTTDKAGYPDFHVSGYPKCRAHRFAYWLVYGTIPEGLVLDHLCRNRNCVNPTHLEPVTQRENVHRGLGIAARNRAKTHCPQGHPYDEVNTTVVTFTTGRKARYCRACMRDRYAKRVGHA